MTKSYTISELATECGCSKTTMIKHLTNKGLNNSFLHINGKQVKVYDLDSQALGELKKLISSNKGNVSTYATMEEVLNWKSKYNDMKNLYDLEVRNTKLLTDREADHLKNEKELNAEIANLNGTIGGLNTSIEFLKKSEASKILIIKCLSTSLAILIMGAILKVFFS